MAARVSNVRNFMETRRAFIKKTIGLVNKNPADLDTRNLEIIKASYSRKGITTRLKNPKLF
jgi:hypothetical protein